jgi:predicted DNA-binding transcriptional regulator AlpA
MKVIKFKELSKKLGGRGRNAIKRDMEKRGFPEPMKIGRSVVWDEEAVDTWLQEQAEKPYQPEPVAVPAPGKRRGRRRKKDSNAAKPKVLYVKEEYIKSDVVRFAKSFKRRNLIPPDEIVADGKYHTFFPEADEFHQQVAWYIFDADKPAMGLYGCLMRDKSWRWSRKAHDVMNDQERADYVTKLRRLRKARKDAKASNKFDFEGMQAEGQ